MPTDRLTPEQIRTLDGTALTRLAHQLGLGPPEMGYDPVTGLHVYGPRVWRPHENIIDADGVFQALRARGWSTTNAYIFETEEGIALASKYFEERDRRLTRSVGYGKGWPDIEPLALLRCAVLAVASEQPNEGKGQL